MAEQDNVSATVEQTEYDPASWVDIEYHTRARWGERFAVPLRVALAEHADATIVAYSDGRPFEGPETVAAVKETKAELRAHAAEQKAAAKADKAAAALASDTSE